MPRKKKNGQSPSRVPGLSNEITSNNSQSGYIQGYEGAMANNIPSMSTSEKEKIVKSMHEMFSHLDSEVIYIVLSECDFKVENAMDSLLELSVAAEVAAPTHRTVSGFELTAAALLSKQSPAPSKQSKSPPLHQSKSPPLHISPMTEELDLLIDQELQILATQPKEGENLSSCQYFSAAAPLSSFPPPPVPQQVLPELLQSSLELGAKGPGEVGFEEQASGAHSPLDHFSFWEAKDTKNKQSVLDYSNLISDDEAPSAKPNPPLDLGASGRPSAFQIYKKTDQPQTVSKSSRVMPLGEMAGWVRSKVHPQSWQQPHSMSPNWNPEAPVFCPSIKANQGPTFITPVAVPLSPWGSIRPALHWPKYLPGTQGSPNPPDTIPKSWARSAAPRDSAGHSSLRIDGKVLVLLRGAPGSGKSSLARAILEQNPGGVVLSTDDYFSRHGEYYFDPSSLGEAHEWNHKRSRGAFERNVHPIVIDNTNMHCWEMKPYVAQALKFNYKVLFREPDTWWKYKPRELARRNKHNVPKERIRRMLDTYERFVSVQAIMGSQPLHQENRPFQPTSSETPCPDLVGEPGFTHGSEKSHPDAFSSLPDVSSIGPSGEMKMAEYNSQSSTETLNILTYEKVKDIPQIPNDEENDDNVNLLDLDTKMDAHIEHGSQSNAQGVPDCIVESVLNEDVHADEMPTAFSESIGQRVRRERVRRKAGLDEPGPADLVKDTNRPRKEEESIEVKTVEGEAGGIHPRPELLDFTGDWPSEERMEQRKARRRDGQNKRKRTEEEDSGREADKHDNGTKTDLGPDVTEFRKLLDLIQTGCSSLDGTLSSVSGEESEKGGEAGDRAQGSQDNKVIGENGEKNVNSTESGRAELPDFVFEWMADDSSLVKESSESMLLESAGGGIAFREKDSREETDYNLKVCSDIVSGGSESTDQGACIYFPCAESLTARETVGENGNHGREEMLNIGGGVSTGADVHADKVTHYTDSGSPAGFSREADGSHIGEVSLSPGFQGSVESKGSTFSGGNQERKQRQGRRSGKQCKLALTFTQNCPSFAPTPPRDSSSSTASIQPQSDSVNLGVDTGCPIQTDPQDFAILWRISHQHNPEDIILTVDNHPSGIIVLSGDPFRFVPAVCSTVSEKAAVHPSGHCEVPYRMVHEKGTQVEEKELGVARSRLESLRILSRHFKLVSFDTLEDLYDKCHQDLEWTTNLLLDSGERFFREDDGEDQGHVWGEDEQNIAALCDTLESGLYVELPSGTCDESAPGGHPVAGAPVGVEASHESASGEVCSQTASLSESTNPESSGPGLKDNCAFMTEDISEELSRNFGGTFSLDEATNGDHLSEKTKTNKSPKPLLTLLRAAKEGEGEGETKQEVTSEATVQTFVLGSACGGSLGEETLFEDMRAKYGGDELSDIDEQTLLLLAKLEEVDKREKEQKKVERKSKMQLEESKSRHLDIQSLELKLPTELALQLTELFGPVGIDPGACSSDDYAVNMDLHFAKLLHQKWKDTIQESQRQAALSYHLLQESSTHRGESQPAKSGTLQADFLFGVDGFASLVSQSETQDEFPIMDHWNVSRTQVSLRDIMTEEQVRQQKLEKARQSRADLDRRDGATLLKENQLYSLFPGIDPHFLQDIFRDHNYNLKETEVFLRSLLDEGSVKIVVAPEVPRTELHRTSSKESEKRLKPLDPTVGQYQDIEDPEYEDFRVEATLQKRRQLENFAKAAEAFKQGKKDVASFYARQGHLHGQRMREANHRAASQIFERVNSSLLPRNILDLHGLHVDEALQHLAQVLQDKTTEYEQGLCRPQLSVITGRGNHSQGGVARIRPAVIDYLTNKHYRFTEPKMGLVLVSLNQVVHVK